MTRPDRFIREHPLFGYYALTFALSWGGLLLAAGPGGFPGTPAEFQSRLPAALLALLAGPSLAGLLLTGLIEGRKGFRGLLSRLFRWKADVRWTGIALLTAPVLFTAVPLALSLVVPELLPGLFSADDKASLLALGLAAGLTTILEELGWTGFAVPRLRSSRGILATGLFAGLLWGLWHLPMNLWSSGTEAGRLAPDRFLHSVLFSLGILPAFRVLMVWVYDRTGSLLVAWFMHASLTAGNVVLVPQASGTPLVIWSLLMAAALWGVVAAVAAARPGELVRPPLRRLRPSGGAALAPPDGWNQESYPIQAQGKACLEVENRAHCMYIFKSHLKVHGGTQNERSRA